jgi:prepilin-type N-terminal cleavage/methylation domain-containing protein
MRTQLNLKFSSGFSLVEMSVVLIILGFVIGALLMPVQAQRQQQAQLQTENLLEISKKSLMGYAQSQGRLPCPATVSGVEAVTASDCDKAVGFLPAATLGVQPVDAQGFAVDGWGNPLRYAVTLSNANAFVTAGGMANVSISVLTPDLRVCAMSTGITASRCSVSATETNYFINNAVAVIYSTGATGAQVAGGADEAANLDEDGVFVSHEPRSASDANGEFDHIMTWISPFVLYNAMIEAGQLH